MSRWRQVGSHTSMPVPVYSGLMIESWLTAPRTALPSRSPTPFTPVDACTEQTVHCMAPAWSVTPVCPSSVATSWRRRTSICEANHASCALHGATERSRSHWITWY